MRGPLIYSYSYKIEAIPRWMMTPGPSTSKSTATHPEINGNTTLWKGQDSSLTVLKFLTLKREIRYWKWFQRRRIPKTGIFSSSVARAFAYPSAIKSDLTQCLTLVQWFRSLEWLTDILNNCSRSKIFIMVIFFIEIIALEKYYAFLFRVSVESIY